MSGDNDTQPWFRCFSTIDIAPLLHHPCSSSFHHTRKSSLSNFRSSIELSLISLYTFHRAVDIDLHILILVLRHHQHKMSFLFRGNIAKSPATYLFKGLFPNLSRYLSGNPRYVSKPGMISLARGHANRVSRPRSSLLVLLQPKSSLQPKR